LERYLTLRHGSGCGSSSTQWHSSIEVRLEARVVIPMGPVCHTGKGEDTSKMNLTGFFVARILLRHG
jgi:hypothetical protein